MGLSKSKQKELCQLKTSNDDELYLYLKESLHHGRISAKDALIYVRDFRWGEAFQYIIDATDINRLGEMIQASPDMSKYAVHFFMLAAKRGSSSGNAHCVPYFLDGNEESGVEQSLRKALHYAQQAVELAKNTEDAHEHKFLLSQVLRANHLNIPTANALLMEYIEFKRTQTNRANNQAEKEKLNKALNEYRRIVKKMDDRLDQLKFKQAGKVITSQHESTENTTSHQDLTYWRCFSAKRSDVTVKASRQNG